MNQPKVRMWAKFVLSPKSGKTPKYVLTDACGWVDELKDLVGRDGYISLYLCPKREGQPIDAPSMYLPQFGIKISFKNLVISIIFRIFVGVNQIVTNNIKRLPNDFKGQSYRNFLYY